MAQTLKKTTIEPLSFEPFASGIKEGLLFIFTATAIYLLVSLVSFNPSDCGWSYCDRQNPAENLGGIFGAWSSDFLLYLFGYFAYLFPIAIAHSGISIYQWESEKKSLNPIHVLIVLIGFIITICSGTGLSHLHFDQPTLPMPGSGGGVLGELISNSFESFFNFIGSTLLLLGLFLSGFSLTTGMSWLKLADETGRIALLLLDKSLTVFSKIYNRIADHLYEKKNEFAAKAKVIKPKTVKKLKVKQELLQADNLDEKPLAFPAINITAKQQIKTIDISERAEKEKQIDLFDMPPGVVLPQLNLLDNPAPQNVGYSPAILEELSRQVELILADFNIKAEVVDVQPGPVVTRFELRLAPGVKVNKVSNLSKDLARALSSVSVRIVEIIPGKPFIGIEIPNEKREIVYLGEILRSKAYDKTKAILPMALGKDISGMPVITDIAKMPHLLVAGTTGSGKSVAINVMILSILYKALPKDVKLIMIDPKMLELSIYEGIPHLLCPVVTDMKEAANALRWCVSEMENRYRLMSEMGVRNVAGHNKKIQAAIDKGEPILDPFWKPEEQFQTPQVQPILEPLPYIVVIIDELADMMMVVGKKVEELIARLAQKARASGIHLILATQRPSVDVITGLIKANIPTRMAFQVSTRIDSRTIIDQMGAEALLGHGDMLYLPPGSGIPTRVHGAFVDDHEVHKIVDFLKQTGEPDYIEDIIKEAPEGSSNDWGGEESKSNRDDIDPLYDEAVKIVTESRRASISSVQRRLKIGYNRAARMIEEMESSGIVTPPESNGSREVLAAPPPPDM